MADSTSAALLVEGLILLAVGFGADRLRRRVGHTGPGTSGAVGVVEQAPRSRRSLPSPWSRRLRRPDSTVSCVGDQEERERTGAIDRRDAGRVRPADLPDDTAGQRAGREGRAAAVRCGGRWRTTDHRRCRTTGAAGAAKLLVLSAPGRDRRRRPGRGRTDRLAHRRWARAAQDERRRPGQVGLVPDGAVRRPGARRRPAVRRQDLPLPPRMPPHAIHGTGLDRGGHSSARRRSRPTSGRTGRSAAAPSSGSSSGPTT